MEFPEPKSSPLIPVGLALVLLGLGLAVTWKVGAPRWMESMIRGGEELPEFGYPLSLPLPEEAPAPSVDLLRATDLLIESVIAIESGGDPSRVGSRGERGLMQIMPGTWREVTKRDLGGERSFDLAFDPEWNRKVGRYHLGHLQQRLYRRRSEWKQDVRVLLFAAYNAGFDRVARAGFDLRNLPASVQDYATRAAALHDWHLAHDQEGVRKLLDAALPGEVGGPDAEGAQLD